MHLLTAFVQAQRCSYAALLASLISVVGCDKAELASDQPTLPVNRTITDTRGRSIDARIVSRSKSAITIIKHPGNTEHLIPLNRLSNEDERFALSLPISAETAKPITSKKPRLPHNQFNTAKLEKVYEEIEEVSAVIQELTGWSIKYRTLMSRLNRLQKEAAKLEKELNDRD